MEIGIGNHHEASLGIWIVQNTRACYLLTVILIASQILTYELIRYLWEFVALDELIIRLLVWAFPNESIVD